MALLNAQTLLQMPAGIKTPAYDLETTGCGIVHLGPGAFHRAHQAVYTEEAMAYGGNWRISAVSMRSRTLKEKLADQDNLYSLAVLDEQPYTQIIAALKNVYVLDEDRQQVMAQLCAQDTYIVTLTITEKGYCLNSQGELDSSHPDIRHDLDFPEQPVSAIGLLVAALKVRRDNALPALTIISCDNLSDNGTKLARAVTAYARHLDSGLADWIIHNICFPNTMVDSITPATDEALISRTEDQTGFADAWPIQREAFTQWVIEDKFSGPRPHWHKVGVTFTDDVHIFEKAKLRILNGTHSTLAYVGSLCGLETVHQAISQPHIEAFIRNLLVNEILPSIDTKGQLDLNDYAEAILARYRNQHIRHLLSQIAWDGSQKLPFRILNTIRDNLKAGHSIERLCVPVAAWVVFIARKQAAGEELTDPMGKQLLSLAASHADDIQGLGNAILDLKDVFAELSQHSEFRDTVLAKLASFTHLNSDNLTDCLGAS